MRATQILGVLLLLASMGCASTAVREEHRRTRCDLSEGIQLFHPKMPHALGLLVEQEAAVEAIGSPDETFDSPWFCTWSEDQRLEGLSRRARYEGLELRFVRPDGRSDFLLQEVNLRSDAFRVACGLRVGDSAEKVLATLGAPHLETIDGDTGNRVMKYVTAPKDSRLHFVVSDGRVVEIRALTWCSIQAAPSVQRTR